MDGQGSLIDLSRSRGLGEILGGAFRLYRAHAVTLSFAALAGTLLFFDARARKHPAYATAQPTPDLDAPERPA